MINQVKDLREIICGSENHIDCYVSTDIREVENILSQLGFESALFKENTFPQIYGEGSGLNYLFFKHPKTQLRVECIDIPLDEAMKQRDVISFTPQSKFRVHSNGSNGVIRELTKILKLLDDRRQNMAFINDAYTKTFVKLSEFYF